MMIKFTSRFVLMAIVAVQTIAISGCGGSDAVVIPENPTKESPGRPSGVGEGDGDSMSPPPPPAAVLPE